MTSVYSILLILFAVIFPALEESRAIGPNFVSHDARGLMRADRVEHPIPDTYPSDDFASEGDIFLPIAGRPNHFSEPHPPDGAQDLSPNTWLAWNFAETPLAAAPITYAVIIAPISEALAAPRIQGINANFWDPFTFETGAWYHWQVIATDRFGKDFPSPVWRFRVEAESEEPDLDAMVEIPGGYFWMGCDGALARAHPCFDKEFPLRQVWIDGFEIDKYEVTNGEYRACVDAGACEPPIQANSNQRQEYYDHPDYSAFPVLYVSQWNARSFCAWEGKRLPTEAEWEKAARGPVDTREWPWGYEYPDCTRSNFTDDRDPERAVNCGGDTDRVGMRPAGASPYGAMDMSGNAFEWVRDFYNVFYYEYAPNINPPGPDYAHTDRGQGPESIPYFTIRGGSYRAHWFYTRATHRHWGHKGPQGTSYDDIPFFRNNFVGFRCARPLP